MKNTIRKLHLRENPIIVTAAMFMLGCATILAVGELVGF